MAEPSDGPVLALDRGGLNYRRRGIRAAPWSDLYHAVIRASWTVFFVWLIATYAVTNLGFALLYLGCGDCIGAEDPGSFLEAFSFSVQTLSTIGFGGLAPTTPFAHIVMWIESFAGLVGVATATGMCFAKFSRPEARVAFSDIAIITTHNGRPSLEFRMANERNSRIVDARLQLYLVYDEHAPEGGQMRRFEPLRLERDRSPVFLLSWTAIHALDGDSPLAEVTPESLHHRMIAIVAVVSGVDDTVVSSMHAQHYYLPDQIRFGHRFVDMMSEEDGVLVIDHSRLHDVVPESTPTVTDAVPEEASE